MEDQIWFHKYRIIKILGRGGSSEVYLAEHIKLKALRAIKRISKNNILHDQLLEEAYLLKNLNHSCIPVIYDFEEDAHNSYIIEQYMEGQTLKMLLNQKGHISENLSILYTIQICELLQYLYSLDKPILYLDINPENVMLVDDTVKLIDFGASWDKNSGCRRKYSLGTRGFAAPELYKNYTADERADIYGVGALLYYMVTGSNFGPASQNKLFRKNIRNCTKKLQGVIKQCLRYYPAFRYSSIAVLKNKLLELSKSNSFYRNSSKSICIGVAGTQNRIGTTHVAFLLTSYISSTGETCLYIEKNNSNHILTLLKAHNISNTDNGIYQFRGCNVQPHYGIELPCSSMEYTVKIMDFGCLSGENQEEFEHTHIKLLVTGGKEWEIEHLASASKVLRERENIKYLFNYTDGKQFRNIMNYMKEKKCCRIPYVPDPFLKKFNEDLELFLSQLWNHSEGHQERKEERCLKNPII